MLSRYSKFKVGTVYYYQSDDGDFTCGEVIQVTSSFCTLKCANGSNKRKAKHLLYDTEEQLKLTFLNKATKQILDNFRISIKDLWNLQCEMIEKHPEKFI